mgnify:CR=1 FL=1
MRVDRFLRNAYTSIRLVAEVTGQSLSAVYQGISLKAEYAIGIFLRFFFASDEADVSEQHTLGVNKNLSESPTVADNDTLTVAKNIADPVALTDVDILAALKALSEAPSVSEAHVTSLTKSLLDIGDIEEDATLSAVKPFTDVSAITDNDTLDVTKDVGGDTDQDYCDASYFLEDYTAGERLDRMFLVDEPEFTYVKNLSDQAFVTDDLDGQASTEDDQEISFVKTRTEIASITDVFDRDVAYIRNFSETPAANDSPAKVVTRPAADSGTATDTFAKNVVYLRKPTDSFDTSDSDTIDFGAVKSEDGLLSDSEVKLGGKFITESPSAVSSGTLRSQGYCDFTYFAEDYVGASRTFT